MKVERLTLRNYRNVTACAFNPDPHLNFLVGSNGQGKTSFLEALGFLATLRSFRGSKSAEVIQHGKDLAEASCVISARDEGGQEWKTELKVRFVMRDAAEMKASKLAYINDKPYRSSTQYLSQRFGSYQLGFHAVVFNPSDHDLVRGEPSVRRAYLDRVLSANDAAYLETLQKYQRVLEQRNALIKAADRPASQLLQGFTEPMARYSAALTQKRLEWLQNLAGRINDIVRQITSIQRPIGVFYVSNWLPKIEGLSIVSAEQRPLHFAGHGHLPSLELLEQAFWNRLSVLEAAEWRAGHSLVGPHRDDWALFLGDQSLKGHGSQGEVRSALLGLKLSEIEIFRNTTGHLPLFLLDDFSSELDRERRQFLLKFLSETDLQVFVTSTEDTASVGKRFLVSNGSIREAGHDHTRQPAESE